VTVQKGVKPATAPTVNGLREVDQLVQQINFQASHFPGDSQAHPHRSGPTPVWSAELPINQHEYLRVELRQHRTHAAIDVRRWRRSPDGELQATERGFALALQHLPAMKALIDAAVVQAKAKDLLDTAVKGGTS
jgi:hypothetical protein